MRQFDSVSEELDPENVQCALDFENTMNELETQLYYRRLHGKGLAGAIIMGTGHQPRIAIFHRKRGCSAGHGSGLQVL